MSQNAPPAKTSDSGMPQPPKVVHRTKPSKQCLETVLIVILISYFIRKIILKTIYDRKLKFIQSYSKLNDFIENISVFNKKQKK